MIGIRWLLLDRIDSTAVTVIVLIVYVVGGPLLAYVTFSWAREYDRRNPRQ